MAIVFMKARIQSRYKDWLQSFELHREFRKEYGISDVMVRPVIGEQAVMIVMETDQPRIVLDSMYGEESRKHIETSGHLLGEEVVTVCE